MNSEESMRERTLTLLNYDVDNKEPNKARVTISPGAVVFVISGEEPYCEINGLQLYKTNVITHGESNLEIFISLLDLTTLERAIGSYFLP
jgi:hypothetical protein